MAPRWFDGTDHLALDTGGGPLARLWSTALSGLVHTDHLDATGTSVKIHLPKTALEGPVDLEWKIPQWSNTLERDRARTYFQAYAAAAALDFIELALKDVRAGKTKTWESFEVPDEAIGCGFTEAVRGVLSHHMVIKGGKIANYHPYPPTPWNANPRDSYGTPGPYEDAVIDTPIFEENERENFKGIDIMRSVRSFDPCLPCGVHMYLGKGKVLKKVHSPPRWPTRTNCSDRTEQCLNPRTSERVVSGSSRLLNELQASADRRSLNLAEELLRLVSDLYGAGLARMVEIARVGARAGGRLRRRRAGRQPLAGAGPAPRPPRRPGGGSTGVRPTLPRSARRRRGAAAIDDEGAVKLRLLGNCDGCPSSAATCRAPSRWPSWRRRPRLTRIVRRGARRRGRTSGVPIASASKPLYDVCPAEVAAMTDPIAVLQRIRERTPGQVPGRRSVRVLFGADPTGTDTWWTSRSRTLLCACRGASSSSTREGAGGDHFQSVPERYMAFDDFELSSVQWDSLQIPVSVAFFFFNS